ncbi:replicative DNA helicase [Halobacillus mangrovi]|uniref:Replicative DNA helicase n=1 Tax=Halobacillus mangrovi TaxID=402384 RepID=A0A1W5ZQU4_9BACI|nr:replicative DNA helicase [Halobacillus mangrovi]ARI75661.1 replicative DNA helicase [Halobacillus mangrovi]
MIQNVEAEQSVLGTLLYDGTMMDRMKLNPEHFSHPSHRLIYLAMQKVFARNELVSVINVTTELNKEIKAAGGVSYLTDLANSIPTTAQLDHHQRLVCESFVNRKTSEMAVQYAHDPNDEKLDKLLVQLENYRNMTFEKESYSTTYHALMEIAKEMTTPAESGMTGFPTGYTELDQMMGGTQRGELIILAGRPSMGKTAFALNLASHHCRTGGKVHLFSLEMGIKSLLKRFISAEAEIDGQKWRSMNFSKRDYDRAINSIGEMSQWNLFIHERSRTVSDIRAKVRREMSTEKQNKETPLIIIDYLQLMNSTDRHERRDLEVGSITRELKLLARELNTPIILLSQLSRSVEQRKDKRPLMSDLRESGNIEQDADVIGFLYREDYYNWKTEEQERIELLLSKQRNGPVGKVSLVFMKEYGKFLDK